MRYFIKQEIKELKMENEQTKIKILKVEIKRAEEEFKLSLKSADISEGVFYTLISDNYANINYVEGRKDGLNRALEILNLEEIK